MRIIRVGVTGGRYYRNKSKVWEVLNAAKEKFGDRMFLVVGCATGLDRYARWWADENLASDKHKTYYADWDRSGNPAGHHRNYAMAISGLDILIAFPGGRGTANMVEQVQELNKQLANIKIVEIKE